MTESCCCTVDVPLARRRTIARAFRVVGLGARLRVLCAPARVPSRGTTAPTNRYRLFRRRHLRARAGWVKPRRPAPSAQPLDERDDGVEHGGLPVAVGGVAAPGEDEAPGWAFHAGFD